MKLRLPVILRIAQRDLASQFRGRRGWVLPLIAGVLLAPLAATPLPSLQGPPPGGLFAVSGEVPAEVVELPSVSVVEGRGLRFERSQADERLEVHGPGVPLEVRAALDSDGLGRPVETVVQPPWPLPGRTLLLALLASSLLTGAVSESLPGERSRNTLEALLTAAVSRAEIVVGKWLAWAGFGAFLASAAGGIAVAFGTMEPGWWLLVLPAVPMGTVALGLFLVRRARDVVGGATVSLRVLPAVLSILGIIAWFVGLSIPEVGAMVPLGGALVAAGGTWAGPLPTVISLALTLVGVVALLAATARDLEQAQRPITAVRWWTELSGVGWAAGAWWLGIGAAAAWAAAGNATVARESDPSLAVAAGALGLFAVAIVRAGREADPMRLLGISTIGHPRGWAGSAIGAIALVGMSWLVRAIGGSFVPDGRVWAFLAERAWMGLWPTQAWGDADGWLLVLATVAIQEIVFRGWLQQRVGPWLAGAAFVLIVAPSDPLVGLAIAGAMGGITHLAKGSVWPAIAARLALILAATWLPGALP